VDPVGRHAALFNQGVRTGDFSAWLSTFADNAELTFRHRAPAVSSSCGSARAAAGQWM
jgi:hypothetical protein